jgi:hypothetical protein
MNVELVIPTIGRPSLAVLLSALERCAGPRPAAIVLVDDRRDRTRPLPLGDHAAAFRALLHVVAGRAAGPAAARNIGWRAASAPWIAFVDDDVIVSSTWFHDLENDLRSVADDTAGVQGRVSVPLPVDRAPTDWERNVAHLADAKWITADFAYRRNDLAAVGGFDERFPRAYREDSDLALRVLARGRRLVVGERTIQHPVRPAPWNISIRSQAGNADDALMDAIHGRAWRDDGDASHGAFVRHVATVGLACVAALAVAAHRPRVAALAGLGYSAAAGTFAWQRIAPGPRTANEVAAMIVTSIAIPFAAVAYRLRGAVVARSQREPQGVPWSASSRCVAERAMTSSGTKKSEPYGPSVGPAA